MLRVIVNAMAGVRAHFRRNPSAEMETEMSSLDLNHGSDNVSISQVNSNIPVLSLVKARPSDLNVDIRIDDWLTQIDNVSDPTKSEIQSVIQSYREQSAASESDSETRIHRERSAAPSPPTLPPSPASSMCHIGRRFPLQFFRRKTVLLLLICIFLYFIKKAFWVSASSFKVHRPDYATSIPTYNLTDFHQAAFLPAEDLPRRFPDAIDTFAGYKYRNECNISSLDLHLPFAPLCQDRASLLPAMSGGGRIGLEAPYMSRGCDMRWFTTEEICEIISRFEKVIFVGDSMMRHVIGSLNVLIREDLGYGAVTDWNFSPQEREQCFCNYQFNVKECSIQGIFKIADVIKNDPESLACPADSIDVMIELMIRHPLDPTEVDRFRSLLSPTKPSKPYAFIFGHGLWNDLDLHATLLWFDEIASHTLAAAPYLAPPPGRHPAASPAPLFPRLMVTPNAAGINKPDEWLMSQGNKALRIFEASVREEMGLREVEHLGTWNMSVQANLFDGVHLDLKGNMVKAMMVLNWLEMVEVEAW